MPFMCQNCDGVGNNFTEVMNWQYFWISKNPKCNILWHEIRFQKYIFLFSVQDFFS